MDTQPKQYRRKVDEPTARELCRQHVACVPPVLTCKLLDVSRTVYYRTLDKHAAHVQYLHRMADVLALTAPLCLGIGLAQPAPAGPRTSPSPPTYESADDFAAGGKRRADATDREIEAARTHAQRAIANAGGIVVWADVDPTPAPQPKARRRRRCKPKPTWRE